MIEMYKDVNGCTVSFSGEKDVFSGSPDHVLVLLHSVSGWVFTRHKARGLEFPGGKREKGETIEAAAIREAYEETGAEVSSLAYLGQYKVECDDCSFVKNVYFARADGIAVKKDYLETDGPVILEKLPEDFSDPMFSFIMRDRTIEFCFRRIEELSLI